MKINPPDPSTVPFSSLEIGDIFKNRDGYIYIRIPKIIVDELDSSPTYNTYDLTNNSYSYFYNDDPVLPYPNATLNLIP